ncbi:hypothetical protein [Sphingobacterium sp. LRF_L2]|uniref:hypothetical protein n=1 Tax=Sphingobacterium sp. LRF_L2 TaxID=3369421 RepID=UPI003F5F931B
MNNALNILFDTVSTCNKQVQRDEEAIFKSALQEACAQTFLEINNIYRNYSSFDMANKAIQHCHKLLVQFHDSIISDTDIPPLLPETVGQLLNRFEQSFHEHLLAGSPLRQDIQDTLYQETIQRLTYIQDGLQQKNIASCYLSELFTAIESLFRKGKLPSLHYHHRHYLDRFLYALEELAADQRKKNWTYRFIQTLLNYNFNYMGMINRWQQQQESTLTKMLDYASQEFYILQQEDKLRLHSHNKNYVFDLDRPSLAKHMKDYLKRKKSRLKKQSESQPIADTEVLLSNLNADELTILFHYSHKVQLFQYSTKREAAKAFSQYVKSKTNRNISCKTLEKFDKVDLEIAAIVIRKKLKEMANLLEKDFKTF